MLSKGNVGSGSVPSSVALRTHAPLARLVLSSPTNPHAASICSASTWPVAISEAKMPGLHLPGARKRQKEGRGGLQSEDAAQPRGEQERREAGPTLA